MSHALAILQSRFTVSVESPRTSAVSSMAAVREETPTLVGLHPARRQEERVSGSGWD